MYSWPRPVLNLLSKAQFGWKWAVLAVLFSRQLINSSHNLFHIFSIICFWIIKRYPTNHFCPRIFTTYSWWHRWCEEHILWNSKQCFFDGFRTKRLMTESKTWVGLASLVRNFNPIIRCWERDLTKQFQDRLYFRSIIIFTFTLGG